MSASTALWASLVAAYFLHLTFRARRDILRFGPAMVAGIGVGLATVAFGALGRGYEFFNIVANIGAAATFILVALAIWRRRASLWQRRDDAA
jgi:lipopolysaccharide export LptBFGC system permease protein LptF